MGEASFFPSAQTRVQIPTGEITEESTIDNQWPQNLPWTPTCTDSTTCKEYNGQEDEGMLTTIDHPGENDGETQKSLGFFAQSSEELVGKTVYVTDVTALHGAIYGTSNHNGFLTPSLMPEHVASGNLLVIDIKDGTVPVDVTGTDQTLLISGTVTAVANSKGGANNNTTLIRNGNFNVVDDAVTNTQAGWHISGASVVEATKNVDNNMTVIDSTKITADSSNANQNVTSIVGAFIKGTASSDVATDHNSLWIKESELEVSLLAGVWNIGASIPKPLQSNNNTVYIKDSSLTFHATNLGKASPGIYGNLGEGFSKDNWVEINGSTLNIAGNKSFYLAASLLASEAKNNTTLVKESVLNSSTKIFAFGGYARGGEASENTILFSNSIVNGPSYIYGGYTETADKANNNKIYLLHSKLASDTVLFGGRAGKDGETASASQNTVVLRDITNLDGGQANFNRVSGGLIGSKGTSAGNALFTDSSFSTKILDGFQHYHLYLNQDSFKYGAFIAVTDVKTAVTLQTKGDLKTSIAIGGSGFDLVPGDSYTLIDSAAGFVDVDGVKLTTSTNLGEIKQDMVIENLPSVIRVETTTITKDDYELAIVDGENGSQSLEMQVNGGSQSDAINGQTDALMESSLSTMTTHFAADDLFVDSVLRSRDGKRDGLFTAARGGKWSFDTRTRIENNIVSGLLGYGAKLSNDLTMGAFIEMGHGSYDTRTHISSSTKAGGGSHNYGGLGVFGDYAMPSFEGLHFTGYLKVGLLRNEFNSNIAGANVDYDRTGVYWGAHLGTHYDWDLTQSIRSRVFLSYFYDGQGDESFDIAGEGDVGGAHVSYDAIHAHRVQLGSMFEFAVSDTWRPYLGLTFEQILAAEAKGTATDAQGTMDLNSSDLEGSTGILSAGWTYQDGNFSTELGLNGYAGTRNGVSGQIQTNWKF